MANGNNNYHIYIHQTKTIEHIHKHTVTHKFTGGGGGGSKPTAPSFGGGDGEFNLPNNITPSAVTKVMGSYAKYGYGGAIVTAIVAVAKATEKACKAAEKMSNLTSTMTGDYTYSIWWSNIMTGVNNTLHPVTALISAQQTEASWARANRKVEEQRTLLGDATINTLTKGV